MESVSPEAWPRVLGTLRRAVRPGGLVSLTVEQVAPPEIATVFAEATAELPPYDERVARERAAREVLGDDVFALVSWLAIAMSAFNRLSIVSRHHLARLT